MAVSFASSDPAHARVPEDYFRAESEGLPGALKRRAAQLPKRSVAMFLERGEVVDEIPSLADLDCTAAALAAHLGGRIPVGERVLLLYPAGLEFFRAFFGCLYAGIIAVPVNMPRPSGSPIRILGILKDATPVAILTTSACISSFENLRREAPELARIPWLATDQMPSTGLAQASAPAVTSESIAFLQYTSGTTTCPRGAIVTHRNVLAQAKQLEMAWSVQPGDAYVSWLPHHHDMGLIGMLAAIYGGGRSILMSPYSFYQDPMRWLAAISKYGARCSCAPNSAYEYCVRKNSVQPDSLDLSRWELAVSGAEPVRYSTMQRFAAKFASCGFRLEAFSPSYGLAEATLGVAVSRPLVPPDASAPRKPFLQQQVGNSVTGEDITEVVGCGPALPDVEVAIVDPNTAERCEEGAVGEIWVSGPNVAQGYWNRIEETERTFRAQIADGAPGRYLRTGDLGFMWGGHVYVSGRIKDLIIIEGRNHYPQDIELTVEQCDSSLRFCSGAAFSTEIEGEERLVVAHELEHPRKTDELQRIAATIRKAVAAEHDLTVHSVRLLRPGSLPRTTSGKIQRHACREAFLSGTLQAVNEGIE